MQDISDDTIHASLRCLGIQRDDRFIVRVCCLHEVPGTIDPVLEVLRGDRWVPLIPRAEQDDGSEIREMQIAVRGLKGKGRRAYRRHPHCLDVVWEDREGSRNAHSVRVRGTRGGDRFHIPWLTDQLCLDTRIPRTPEEFRRRLAFRHGRCIDAQTVLHSAQDVIAANADCSDPSLFAYIVNAFVIYVYKSIEIAREGASQFVGQHLPRILQLNDRVSRGRGGREDPYRSTLSLHTALWHFHAEHGNIAAFDGHLSAIEQMSDPQNSSFDIGCAKNLTSSLLLLGARRGLADAARQATGSFYGTYNLFKQAAVLPVKNAAEFQQLDRVLDNAVTALAGNEQIRASGQLSADFAERAAGCASRVDRSDFAAKLSGLLLSRHPLPASDAP